MRARIRRRQQMRRLTIIATIVIIAVSLGVGIYFVATSSQGSKLDAFDNKPVSASDMSSLVAVSAQPYGPAAPASMQSALQKYGGSPFVSAGKPTVVYIGGEFCPYCAVERWSLIMALSRFGNFTNIHYTTSANTEGDYATFTFVGSSYSSKYISFRPYEASDRSQNSLQAVPSNYSSLWASKGGGVPYVNFGNTYLSTTSILADPGILAGKNWTSILTGIQVSDGTGLQLREAANLVTAVVCKLTQGAPVSVCSASPIASQTSSIAAPYSAGLAVAGAGPGVKAAGVAPSLATRRPG